MKKSLIKNKLVSEWKAIDKILGVDCKKLSENVKKKYFALKSLLIKESTYFRQTLKVPDYKQEMLTENTALNVKDLVSYVDTQILELCQKKSKVAKKISEISMDKNSPEKREIQLETLMLGDVYGHLSENNIKKIDDLSLMISKELIEGYIKSLIEVTYNYNKTT